MPFAGRFAPRQTSCLPTAAAQHGVRRQEPDPLKPSVHGICGFIGSGKTTYAKRLCKEIPAFLFSMDDWVVPLFGEFSDREDLLTVQAKLNSLFLESSLQLIRLGQSVVLDSGLWKYSQRQELRTWAHTNDLELTIHYLDESFETCRRRALARNSDPDYDYYQMTPEALDFFWTEFEPPDKNENLHYADIHLPPNQ